MLNKRFRLFRQPCKPATLFLPTYTIYHYLTLSHAVYTHSPCLTLRACVFRTLECEAFNTSSSVTRYIVNLCTENSAMHLYVYMHIMLFSWIVCTASRCVWIHPLPSRQTPSRSQRSVEAGVTALLLFFKLVSVFHFACLVLEHKFISVINI